MRALQIIALMFAVVACRKEQSLDCTKMDLKSLDRCFEQNRAKGEPASLVACLPFSDPLVTNGIWVVGFEKNDFFEGWDGRFPPGDLWTGTTGAGLIVDEKVLERIAPVGPATYAWEVDVVGRRALCPAGILNPYPIVVEKLNVRRRIGKR
jgi:hypothetical protein